MAALDILQTVRDATTPGSTTKAVSFSAVAPGDLLLFIVCNQLGSTTVTPPVGVTTFTNRATEWPRLSTHARVAQAGDSTSWTFTFSASEQANVVHAYRIEGPFSTLADVTITDDASFAGVASRRVLLSDVTVAANTLVIATIGQYELPGAPSVSWSNSFTNAIADDNGANCLLSTSRRLYTSAATDVSTTASWTGNDGGNAALIRIATPSGGGTTTPFRPYYRKLCKLTK